MLTFPSERTQGAFILISISRVSLAGKEIELSESDILGAGKRSIESIWGRGKQTDCKLPIAKCKLQICARLSGKPWSSIGSIEPLVQFDLEFVIGNSWRSRLSGALGHAHFPSFANGFSDAGKWLGQIHCFGQALYQPADHRFVRGKLGMTKDVSGGQRGRRRVRDCRVRMEIAGIQSW